MYCSFLANQIEILKSLHKKNLREQQDTATNAMDTHAELRKFFPIKSTGHMNQFNNDLRNIQFRNRIVS